MKSYTKKVILFTILAILLASLIISLFFFNPEELINKIGVTNAYLFLFIISFFGGFSAGGSFSFIAVLTTLAVGGLNPWLLGITAGIALVIGDLIMFSIALKGRHLIRGKAKEKIDKFSKWVDKKAHAFIPFIAYLYIGLTPFPNDLMVISLAAIDYPVKKAYLPILLGDLTFAILVAFLASIGITLFF
jgi:membrane protein YqaA with SNARE-associated domain